MSIQRQSSTYFICEPELLDRNHAILIFVLLLYLSSNIEFP